MALYVAPIFVNKEPKAFAHSDPSKNPHPVALAAGTSLACSNALAGWLSDMTVRQGAGYTGCFVGASVACALSMLALGLFSILGDLGRDDLLCAAQPGLLERMRGMHPGTRPPDCPAK